MVRLAERCDCAVGTAYGYFPSKSALLAAVVGSAIDTLRRSELAACADWDGYLDEHEVGEEEAALVRLVAHGAFTVAASIAHPHEVAMLQMLLGGRAPTLPADELEGSLDVLAVHLSLAMDLLGAAVEAEALTDGDAEQRAVEWAAALNGVLLVDSLGDVAPRTFRPAHLARALTADLLTAWGAAASKLAAASRHVERLAALGPLAPQVDPDG